MFRLRDPRFVHAPTAAHRRDLNAAIARLGAEIAQLELRTAMGRSKTANHLRTTLLVSVLLASSISISKAHSQDREGDQACFVGCRSSRGLFLIGNG